MVISPIWNFYSKQSGFGIHYIHCSSHLANPVFHQTALTTDEDKNHTLPWDLSVFFVPPIMPYNLIFRAVSSLVTFFPTLLMPPWKEASPRTGVLTSGLWTGSSCWISGSIRLEIKYSINVMHPNHPKTTPSSPVRGNLSSTKLVLAAKKVGGRLPGIQTVLYQHLLFHEIHENQRKINSRNHTWVPVPVLLRWCFRESPFISMSLKKMGG